MRAKDHPKTSPFTLFLGLCGVFGVQITSVVVLLRSLSDVHAMGGWKFAVAILLALLVAAPVFPLLKRLADVFGGDDDDEDSERAPGRIDRMSEASLLPPREEHPTVEPASNIPWKPPLLDTPQPFRQPKPPSPPRLPVLPPPVQPPPNTPADQSQGSGGPTPITSAGPVGPHTPLAPGVGSPLCYSWSFSLSAWACCRIPSSVLSFRPPVPKCHPQEAEDAPEDSAKGKDDDTQAKETQEKFAAPETLAKAVEKDLNQPGTRWPRRAAEPGHRPRRPEAARSRIVELEDEKKRLVPETEPQAASQATTSSPASRSPASRVVFLIDMSGSAHGRGVGCKEPAYDKLARCAAHSCQSCASLPELEKYQVILFSSTVSYLLGADGNWLDYDAKTSPTRVEEELKKISPDGGTNMYDAFLEGQPRCVRRVWTRSICCRMACPTRVRASRWSRRAI